ncbi:hypothetical protein [uncultured Acinetobacter sp.]|uniref:hypothetical protein n=1 Tax=uncultured Acinetobacter sp. TaxID=165433 RepID=UPI00258978A2|nr:hypothetical protein [uncultured Acinetobacter sp.]
MIKQTLLATQINIHTETSKSLTLETTPTVESGEPKLYYIYRSLPKILIGTHILALLFLTYVKSI